jgi:hypothetical protein
VAINTGKVIAGGLVAGVVMNAIDWAANTFLLMDRWKAEMDALNPALSAKAMAGNAMIGFVLIDFVCALLIVWTYAAIRPRFGPGPGTATKVGLLFWVFGGAIWASLCVAGVFSWGFYAIGACVALVNTLVTANVGGMVYKED